MFLSLFLRYFRPYWARLALAILATVFVGLLSVAPVLIFRESLVVIFIAGGGAPGQDLSDLGDLQHLVNLPDPNAPPKPQPEWDTKLENFAGSIWTAPRDFVKARTEQFNAWYGPIRAGQPIAALRVMAIALVLLTMLKGFATFISKYQLSYVFFLTNLNMREDIFRNILRQDYLFFNKYSAGHLHSRINSDVKEIRTMLERLASDGIQQPVTIVIMLGLLIYLSFTLTLVVMLILPLVGWLLYYFAKVLRRNVRKQKTKNDKLSSGMTESLNSVRLVKAIGTEDLEITKFHRQSMDIFAYMMGRRIAKFASGPMIETLSMLSAAGVIMLGAWMIFSTPPRMVFADFAAYIFSLSRLYRPMKAMADMTQKWQEARVSCERIGEMLTLTPKMPQTANPVPFSQLKHAIEFRDLCFSYGEENILHDVSMTAPAGSKIAFVGPSGSGKTTLVNMLARLFDPSRGAILIDGVDLREINMKDWRAHLAIVTQDTVLFDDTIENNIAYGAPGIDRNRLESAAKAAHAHDFIMELDGGRGYRTRIGPTGANLSGGQRQRLAIARAIYRDPQILILDEATSALDAQSQSIVQEALRELMVGRTTFIIAHRISTVRDVDCIYVLDKGRIVESGPHVELLARNGFYAKMVAGGLPGEHHSEDEDSNRDISLLEADQ